MSTPKETFQTAVKAQINGDRKHGWGVEDSLAIIIALLADETGATADDIKKDSAEMVACIKSVINPSAFRQKLEAKGGLLDEAESKRSGTIKGVMDGLFAK